MHRSDRSEAYSGEWFARAGRNPVHPRFSARGILARMSIPLRALVLFVAMSSIVGCRRPQVRDAGPPPEPPIERSRLAAPRTTSSGTAFDLAPIANGAVLVWGRPGRLGGGLVAMRLDEFGGAVGQDVVLFEPPLPQGGVSAERIAEDALEIDATAARGSLAVVWVARDAMNLSVKSLVGDVANLRASRATLLGRTTRATTAARGNVAIAANADGNLHALVRLDENRCTDGSDARCVHVGHAEIRPTEVRAIGVPLEIPTPCPAPVSGIAWVGGRFHYGVCSARTGQPVTTVYTIESESAVARTEDVLPGCATDGFVATADELLVPGRCPGGRAGARMAANAQAMRAMPMEALSIRCEGRTPILTTEGAIGATVRLVAPLDRLETILPSNVVPEGARAVWTGSTVLIAQPIGGEVALHRFGCEEGEFRQTDYF